MHVFGQVAQDGPWAARLRDAKRLGDDVGDVRGRFDEETVLRDGHRHAQDVGLLERLCSEGGARDLPGYGHDGHAVHKGCCESRDEVGRAGSARGDADAGASGGACVPVSRMRGGLLMTTKHVPQTILVAVQRVVEREDRSARAPE